MFFHISEIEICNKKLKVYNKKILDKKDLDRGTYKITLASYLGNIYNGFEFIFEQILKDKRIKILKTDYWHKEILKKLFEIKFISKNIFLKLDNYRKYRHFWRHSYVNKLEEKYIKQLAKEIINIYPEIEIKILSYLIDEHAKHPNEKILPIY